MIEVKHVVKSFDGGEPVLKDISAVFEAGKVNMIIGPSGSGQDGVAEVHHRPAPR